MRCVYWLIGFIRGLLRDPVPGPDDCPYCGARGEEACSWRCPSLKPCCGGLGVVIDLERPLGFDGLGVMQFAGRECPVCAEAP